VSEHQTQGGSVQSPEQRRDALVGRIFGSCIGFMEILSIHVGDRLGLYQALVEDDGATAFQLADATATDERYAREWLEQQAVAGILEVDDADAQPEERRYRLPEGLADRVTFRVRDAADPEFSDRYDLAIAIECIHDMSRPVEALRAMRSMVGNDGAVLVVDERVGEDFKAPSDETERLMYGFSVLHCLPVGMAEQPSAATGTVMRPATLRHYV
jgi:hypothetical protein